jgi:hypothetical protein
MKEIGKEQKEGKTIFDVFSDIEMPLVSVLRAMEQVGIRLDGSILTRLSKEMEREIDDIQREIFTLAGREFQREFAQTTLGNTLHRPQNSDDECEEDENRSFDGFFRARKAQKRISDRGARRAVSRANQTEEHLSRCLATLG